MKEKISALIDAELKGRECDRILRECRKNRDLRRLWQRYHLIGAALRKELEIVPEPSLVDRIVRNLQDSETRQHQFNFLFERSPKRLFLTATAALVSLVILIVPFIIITSTHIADSGRQTAQTSKIASTSSALEQSVLDRQRHDWEDMPYAFLLEHNEFSQISNMNGVMSYVRIAGYDNNPQE